MQVQAGQIWRTVAGNVVEIIEERGDGYVMARQLSRAAFNLRSVFMLYGPEIERSARFLGWRAARFWDYRFNRGEGWVKLTVRHGRPLSFASFRYTDEGWDRSGETYEHEGDGVRFTWWSEGADCDGRLDQGGEAFCPLANLSAGEGHDGHPRPAWEAGERHQRDYAAEAAGY